jgi:hypothetical protein
LNRENTKSPKAPGELGLSGRVVLGAPRAMGALPSPAPVFAFFVFFVVPDSALDVTPRPL